MGVGSQEPEEVCKRNRRGLHPREAAVSPAIKLEGLVYLQLKGSFGEDFRHGQVSAFVLLAILSEAVNEGDAIFFDSSLQGKFRK